MAKAKKSEKVETTPAAAADATAKKPPAATAKKKSPSKPATAAAAPGMPSINTSLAAENAAKHLVAGLKKPGTGSTSSSGKPESSMFKQLKSGLNKPGGGLGNLLDKTHGPASIGGTKSNQPFGANKQVGHNQTFGADVNRAGVPRRTGGG